MIGKKFGQLTILEELPERKRREKVYKCQCECGAITYVIGSSLRNGNTKSCGCLSKLNHHRTHDKTNTRLYRIYNNMKERCYNKQYQQYKDWGARGITICDEWLNDFMLFYDWAISNGYNDNLSIDRVDNSKGYSPDNCRWVTSKEQNRNKRSNIYLTYNGQTKLMVKWAEELAVPYGRLQNRYYRNWSAKEILFGRATK